MPPDQRPIPRFIAEPPHDAFPYGRWAEQLGELFLDACREVDTEGEEVGEPQQITWFPDRTLGGRTYIPASASTSEAYELFGYVSFTRGEDDEPADFYAEAEFTDETAADNPDWKLDLSDMEISGWAGTRGLTAQFALVWGVALVPGGALATGELGPTTTDQCDVVEDRFTLVSLDGWTGDLLEVKLWGRDGGELAAESLYEDE